MDRFAGEKSVKVFGQGLRRRVAAGGAERARVARIFPGGRYGFLETADGREVYFHERAVLDGAFPRLRAGQAVRFTEEPGDEGPQASTVALAFAGSPAA